MFAAMGKLHQMDYLLTNHDTHYKNADLVNQKNLSDGASAAHCAAKLNRMDALSLLIEHGADVHNVRDNDNTSPIEELVTDDNLELFKCLYKPGQRTPKEPSTFQPLHMAAGREGNRCFRLMMELGASHREFSNEADRAQPLHFAGLGHALTNCQMLFDRGADPNAQDVCGNTPYHYVM